MKNIVSLLALVSLVIAFSSATVNAQITESQAVDEAAKSTFSIKLSVEACDAHTHYTSEYQEELDSTKDFRIITSNSIPDHSVGAFPNAGNPNTISPQNKSYRLDLTPEKAKKMTPGRGISFGILLNGVELDPFTNEFFRGKNGINRDWNINGLTSAVNLGTDCNNAHVQPSGKYHYHGTPNAFLQERGVDGTQMIKVGYAADGFPIYYKYGLDDTGKLIELKSAYSLKKGEREGNGKTAPSGVYDGTYFQDYEFVEGSSKLDACNGRFGKTPESEGEYYYVITDNFPSSPICFAGTPSDDFKIGKEGGGNRPPEHRGGQGGRPEPSQMMEQMDANGDNQLEKSEVRGPLLNDFDRLDSDGDGYISLQELENAGLPRGRPE
ncbi:MAG: hypothetical protein ACI837_003552 [Crocinitomicaceae bacterium]|jgi:hypothetical protein